MNKDACPVCKLKKYIKVEDVNPDLFCFECVRCGKYLLSGAAESMMSNAPDLLLSAWIRENTENGYAPITINSESLSAIRSQFRKYTPTEKQTALLQAISKKSNYPGDWVSLLPEFDFPLCWATTEEEFVYYLRATIGRDFVATDGMLGFRYDDVKKVEVQITPKGWEYLDGYLKNLTDKRQVFVAMSFSAEMESAWEMAIKPAIENSGYKAYRIDKNPHNERIDVKIMSEIKNSRFIVSDFTGNKHGVYFEAGYALGLGIPVIWCIKKKDIDGVHFDTRQYNHITWETERDLKEKLISFINVVIGKPG